MKEIKDSPFFRRRKGRTRRRAFAGGAANAQILFAGRPLADDFVAEDAFAIRAAGRGREAEDASGGIVCGRDGGGASAGGIEGEDAGGRGPRFRTGSAGGRGPRRKTRIAGAWRIKAELHFGGAVAEERSGAEREELREGGIGEFRAAALRIGEVRDENAPRGGDRRTVEGGGP